MHSTRQSLAIQKKQEKFIKPTTQESSSPSGGGGNVRFVPSFFFFKFLSKCHCQLKLLKLEGTQKDIGDTQRY